MPPRPRRFARRVARARLRVPPVSSAFCVAGASRQFAPARTSVRFSAQHRSQPWRGTAWHG
eukprot:11179328-Lingulodinium_polyedra.AAC.1